MIAITILMGVLMFFVLVGIALYVATPMKDCTKTSIFRHETVIDGSMHRVCIKCGAEFDADYFEARNGGGNVMHYYRMTKPPLHRKARPKQPSMGHV